MLFLLVDLTVLAINRLHIYGDRRALELLENFVFQTDTRAFLVQHRLDMANKATVSKNDLEHPFILSTMNALYLLSIYYQNDSNKYRWLMVRIENSMIMGLYELNHDRYRYFYEILLSQFMFIRKQFGFHSSFDDQVGKFLNGHRVRIDQMLLNLTPYSDYYKLEDLFRDLIEYYWRTMEFQNALDLCNSIIIKFNEIREKTDNRVILDTIQRITERIRDYRQFFMLLLEDIEPRYDEEFDEFIYHDYNHPFVEDEFRINCIDLTMFMVKCGAYSEYSKQYKSDPRESFYLHRVGLVDPPDTWWLYL